MRSPSLKPFVTDAETPFFVPPEKLFIPPLVRAPAEIPELNEFLICRMRLGLPHAQA
jgi:hypothetical protein